MDRQLEQRQNIISEFISTEKAYLDKLKTVLEVYITPLRESNILDQTDLHLQFGHWEMIYGIHKDLYAKMIQQQQSSSGQVNMGKLFSDFSDYLRVYKTYVANFEVAMTKRAALVSSNRRFSSFLDRARSDPRCVAGIESLIIIPIQRIPRYRMLLEQLLKYTSQLDPEYNAISESLSKVSEAANINNEAIKVQENKRYIMEVMMAIEIKSRPNLLDNPNRRLLKCGSLRRQIKKGKSEKEFMFWLFSDKLIYGEPIPGIGQIQYSLNRDIPLAEARVRDYKVGNGSDADYDSGFTVESTVKSFVVYAQKQEDKVSWLLVLENAIKASKAEKKATAAAVIAASNNPETVEVAEEEDLWFQPLWRNDSGISCCEVCNSNFWLLASKVHCCGCGVVACDRCISNKAYLSHYNTQDVVPVCTPCYDRYLNKEKKAYIKDMRETSNSVTIREPSRAELERHLKVRNGAIRQIQRTESSHVNMLNNARLNPVNLCTLCVSEFSMMKSKQTCMNCGCNVCGECSRRKFLIPYVNPDKESRVCNDCFYFLASGASAFFERNMGAMTTTTTTTTISTISSSLGLGLSVYGEGDECDDEKLPFDFDAFLKFKQELYEGLDAKTGSKTSTTSSTAVGNTVNTDSSATKTTATTADNDNTVTEGTIMGPTIYKYCQACSIEFTLFNAKQNCRKCTASVCGECNKRKLFIQEKEVLVCETCHFQQKISLTTKSFLNKVMSPNKRGSGSGVHNTLQSPGYPRSPPRSPTRALASSPTSRQIRSNSAASSPTHTPTSLYASKSFRDPSSADRSGSKGAKSTVFTFLSRWGLQQPDGSLNASPERLGNDNHNYNLNHNPVSEFSLINPATRDGDNSRRQSSNSQSSNTPTFTPHSISPLERKASSNIIIRGAVNQGAISRPRAGSQHNNSQPSSRASSNEPGRQNRAGSSSGKSIPSELLRSSENDTRRDSIGSVGSVGSVSSIRSANSTSTDRDRVNVRIIPRDSLPPPPKTAPPIPAALQQRMNPSTPPPFPPTPPSLPYSANGSKNTPTPVQNSTSTKRQSSFRFFSREPKESTSGSGKSDKSQGSNSGSGKETGTNATKQGASVGGPGVVQSLLARTSSFRASSFRTSNSILGSLTRKSSMTSRTTASSQSSGAASFQEDFSFDNVY